ncbi:MAG: winged helix-turn-helix transcriptional regulator [Ruminococcus sp.]|nr:winged helix-turn-helix transcriptional regulator [Ruminococcus sp.]
MVERYEKFSSAVSGISNCIQKIEAEVMNEYGLKGSCAQYLTAMRGSKDGITVSGLSEVCAKDKAAVSRAVAELEAKGFVERKGAGAGVYRVPVVLTDKGKSVAECVAKKASAAVEIAGKGLSDEERKIFYSVLDLIAINLLDISKKGLNEK